MEQRTCEACGRAFTPTMVTQRACPPTDADRARAGRQARSRCARKLANAASRRRPVVVGAVGVPYDCAECGARCVPGYSVAPHATRFCGPLCKRAWHLQHVTRRRRRRERAARRLERASRGQRGNGTIYGGQCSECGEWFLSRRQQRQCSKACGRRVNRRLRRSAQRAGERIGLHEIATRDGWRCGICGELVDAVARVPDALAPTLDHVVALARGGSHTVDNVQLAHFICNSRKRDLAEPQECVRAP